MIYFRSTVRALQGQIDDLQRRLDASERERQALLDRLLERNHFEPVHVAQPVASDKPPIQAISPFGTIPAEAEAPLRESWIEEEAAYIQMMQGLDEMRARSEAERRFVEQGIAIKLN